MDIKFNPSEADLGLKFCYFYFLEWFYCAIYKTLKKGQVQNIWYVTVDLEGKDVSVQVESEEYIPCKCK
jgi:hypothetical protein